MKPMVNLKLSAVVTFKAESFDDGIQLEDELNEYLEGWARDSRGLGQMKAPTVKVKLTRRLR